MHSDPNSLFKLDWLWQILTIKIYCTCYRFWIENETIWLKSRIFWKNRQIFESALLTNYIANIIGAMNLYQRLHLVAQCLGHRLCHTVLREPELKVRMFTNVHESEPDEFSKKSGTGGNLGIWFLKICGNITSTTQKLKSKLDSEISIAPILNFALFFN